MAPDLVSDRPAGCRIGQKLVERSAMTSVRSISAIASKEPLTALM
jgi:hypothetical protein